MQTHANTHQTAAATPHVETMAGGGWDAPVKQRTNTASLRSSQSEDQGHVHGAGGGGSAGWLAASLPSRLAEVTHVVAEVCQRRGFNVCS